MTRSCKVHPSTSTGAYMRGAWRRAAVTIVMLALCAAVAKDAAAQDERRRLSLHIEAGLVTDHGAGKELWRSGGFGGGAVMYTLTPVIGAGAWLRFYRWDFDDGTIIDTLVPEGRVILALKSGGEREVFELTPTLRLRRKELLFEPMEGHLDVTAGVHIIDTFARIELIHAASTSDPKPVVARYDIDSTALRVAAGGSVGVSFGISDESAVELSGSYRAVFGDPHIDGVFGISLGFRLDVASWGDVW